MGGRGWRNQPRASMSPEHLEAAREYDRARPRKPRKPNHLLWRHGLTQTQFDDLWKAQGGCCYLCEQPLSDLWAIDHDHDCCSDGKSCDDCRRGIAHRTCNALIGMAADDPALLEKIASNLRAAAER